MAFPTPRRFDPTAWNPLGPLRSLYLNGVYSLASGADHYRVAVDSRRGLDGAAYLSRVERGGYFACGSVEKEDHTRTVTDDDV